MNKGNKMEVGALYQQAEKFLPWNLNGCVFNTTIIPYWTEKALYYFQNQVLAKSLIRIDIQSGKKEPILDYEKLLERLFLKSGSDVK